MTTENKVPMAPDLEDLTPDELTLLKQRADMMGISYSNNIGVDALKAKIAAKQNEGSKVEPKTETNALTGEVDRDDSGKSPGQLRAEARQRLYAEQMKLIRVNITNLNPAKSDLKGEVFTVANDVLGTVRKYVPYSDEESEAYHIPNWIYQQLLTREYQQVKVKKDKRTGVEIVIPKMVKEFSIEVLPALDQDDLDKLAAAQKAAGSVD